MKPYTLRFFSERLESQYQDYNMQRYQKVFMRNLLYYGCATLAVCIYSIMLADWRIILFSFLHVTLVVPIIYFNAKKGPIHFDYSCFFFQIALASSTTVLYLFDLIQYPLQDARSYLTGQSITFAILSFNLGSRFYLKGIVILFNTIVQIWQTFTVNEFTLISLFWLGSNFIILNNIYWHDRIQKEGFLIKNNEKLWQKEIGSFAQISILTCVHKKGNLELDFNRCNKISQEKFNIFDQESFKLFLNNVKTIPKHKFTPQIQREMKSRVKSKKFLQLHTKIYNFSELSSRQYSELIGLYHDCIYNIKIFTTWDNQQLNIHTLLTTSTTQPESETYLRLKYERKLFSQYRLETLSSLRTIFIKMKSLNFHQDTQKIHVSVMSDLQNSLRFTQNIQLFLNPQYEIVKSDFFLQPLMNKIISIIKNSIPSEIYLRINCYIDPELKLQSCQNTIFQIVINLLSIIVRPAKKSGYMIVTAKSKLDKLGSYVTLCIATNIQSTKNLIDIQNYGENIYEENMVHTPHNKRVGLEVFVSEYLVGKIGPYRRIKFIDFSEDKQIICFNIYQDLEDGSSSQKNFIQQI